MPLNDNGAAVVFDNKNPSWWDVNQFNTQVNERRREEQMQQQAQQQARTKALYNYADSLFSGDQFKTNTALDDLVNQHLNDQKSKLYQLIHNSDGNLDYNDLYQVARSGLGQLQSYVNSINNGVGQINDQTKALSQSKMLTPQQQSDLKNYMLHNLLFNQDKDGNPVAKDYGQIGDPMSLDQALQANAGSLGINPYESMHDINPNEISSLSISYYDKNSNKASERRSVSAKLFPFQQLVYTDEHGNTVPYNPANGSEDLKTYGAPRIVTKGQPLTTADGKILTVGGKPLMIPDENTMKWFSQEPGRRVLAYQKYQDLKDQFEKQYKTTVPAGSSLDNALQGAAAYNVLDGMDNLKNLKSDRSSATEAPNIHVTVNGEQKSWEPITDLSGIEPERYEKGNEQVAGMYPIQQALPYAFLYKSGGKAQKVDEVYINPNKPGEVTLRVPRIANNKQYGYNYIPTNVNDLYGKTVVANGQNKHLVGMLKQVIDNVKNTPQPQPEANKSYKVMTKKGLITVTDKELQAGAKKYKMDLEDYKKTIGIQ